VLEYKESFIFWNQSTEKNSRLKSKTLLHFPATRQGHVISWQVVSNRALLCNILIVQEDSNEL
jgi:hypothetical protein